MQKITQIIARFRIWFALLAGAVSAMGFAPLTLWPAAILGLSLFIYLVATARSWRGALFIGWLFGVAHFTLGNNWIAVAFTFQAAMPIWLGYIAVVGLAIYLAVYPAMAAAGAYYTGDILRRRGANAT